MAALTPVTIVKNGGIDSAPASAASGGDSFANDGTTRIGFINAGAGNITVTIAAEGNDPATGIPRADQSLTVVNNSNPHMAGPFNGAAYNDASGNINLTYSGVSSLTIFVVKDA